MARATGLREGEDGVLAVLRAIRGLPAASTRAVSRATGLPVPVVSAVHNELRARGVLTVERPSSLTPYGEAVAGQVTGYTGPVVRQATVDDLDRLAELEVTIAEVSFGDDAVRDPVVHRARLAEAMEKNPAGMLVAVDRAGTVVGWLWLQVTTNFVTRARQGNFRSFAVTAGDTVDARGAVADALFTRAFAYADTERVTDIVGRVHIDNRAMRVRYRQYGFEPAHVTVRRRLSGGD